MRSAALAAAGAVFVADPSGALVWPERGLLVVADLHLEKGSALARAAACCRPTTPGRRSPASRPRWRAGPRGA